MSTYDKKNGTFSMRMHSNEPLKHITLTEALQLLSDDNPDIPVEELLAPLGDMELTAINVRLLTGYWRAKNQTVNDKNEEDRDK
jgi:hypothetical protein